MHKYLTVEEVLATIADCQRSIEKLRRVVTALGAAGGDELEALRGLRIRCGDSAHTITLWSKKGLPVLNSEDHPSVYARAFADAVGPHTTGLETNEIKNGNTSP